MPAQNAHRTRLVTAEEFAAATPDTGSELIACDDCGNEYIGRPDEGSTCPTCRVFDGERPFAPFQAGDRMRYEGPATEDGRIKPGRVYRYRRESTTGRLTVETLAGKTLWLGPDRTAADPTHWRAVGEGDA